MELPDTTSGVPLVLARSVKIRPGGNLEVPFECTRQLTDQMDIRIDTGFHHKNPNICIPPSCINNPYNKYNPRYMPLTIFYLSKVDHLYVMPTGMEEAPKVALDIHCLQRGGRVALTQTINLIPPRRGDGGAQALMA